jgi:hypothetical protein
VLTILPAQRLSHQAFSFYIRIKAMWQLKNLRFSYLVLLSSMFLQSCRGDCLGPTTFEEEYASSTHVVRLRFTGLNTTTSCYYEVQDNPGDYVLTNSVPSYSVEEVFKGDLSKGDVIPLLLWTDTGLNRNPYSTEDDVLVFMDSTDQCSTSDGEYLYQYPTDMQGPRPYEFSECNFHNSLWRDVSNSTKELLKALESGDSDEPLSTAPTALKESALSDDSSASSGANAALFWMAGFSLVIIMFLV